MINLKKQIINNLEKLDDYYIFEDFNDFKPNLSPKEIFHLGSFGGTYWRPIYSSVNDKMYINVHKKYPQNWWKNFENKSINYLTLHWDNYNKNINKYNVKVGQTLEEWEKKDWISSNHPYGWIHWYCDIFINERCDDDLRQIKRWKGLASKNGRFRKWLITLIIKKFIKKYPDKIIKLTDIYKYSKNGKFNSNSLKILNNYCKDYSISPKIRQTLQHWGYKLTFNNLLQDILTRDTKLKKKIQI